MNPPDTTCLVVKNTPTLSFYRWFLRVAGTVTSLVVDEDIPAAGYLPHMLTAASLSCPKLDSLTLPLRESASLRAVALLTNLRDLDISEWRVVNAEGHFAALKSLIKLTVRIADHENSSHQ